MDLHNPSQDQFWSLLAKKMSKEANAEELQELHSILLNNPNLHHHADMLMEMWDQLKTAAPGNEAAYMRHVMKYKDEFFVTENPEQTSIEESLFEEKPGLLRSILRRRGGVVFSIAFLSKGLAEVEKKTTGIFLNLSSI